MLRFIWDVQIEKKYDGHVTYTYSKVQNEV
jgi:hypothetical protein